MNFDYYLTTGTKAVRCSHETSTAARVGDDTVASVWQCDDCDYARPFTSADFAFANSYAWVAPHKRAFAFAR